MSKKTKESAKDRRIREEKVDLFNRLYDMLAGAAGGASLQDGDDDGDVIVMSSIGMDQLSGWMRAAKNYLSFERDTEAWPQSWTDDELRERAFHFDNLANFDTLNKAVDHLYSYGFRA